MWAWTPFTLMHLDFKKVKTQMQLSLISFIFQKDEYTSSWSNKKLHYAHTYLVDLSEKIIKGTVEWYTIRNGEECEN